MKYLLILLSLLFASNIKAQNLNDSTITLTLTQRSAIYIGYYVKNNTSLIWANRLAPSALKPYIGTGTHLDSLFSVTLKCDYIIGLINILLTSPDEVVQVDRASILNNSPAVPGYTALATQVFNISQDNLSTEKNRATFLVNYYNTQVAQLGAARQQIINNVIEWSKN